MEPENTYQPPLADIGGDRQPLPGRRSSVRGDVIEELSKTRPWVLFLSILAFLSCGLMGLGVLFMGFALVAGGMSEFSGSGMESESAVIFVAMVIYGLIFLVSIVIYFFLGLHLFRYASSISKLKDDASNDSLLEAMTHQRKFWRLMGILVLVGVGLYALFFVVAIAGGILGAFV